MNSIQLKYGFVTGTIIVVYSLITLYYAGDFSTMDQTKFKMLETLGYLRYLILLVMLYFGLAACRKKSTGPVTFRSLLRAGVVLTLVVSVMVGLMEMIYIYLHPEFYEQYGAVYLQHMQASGASADDIAKAKESMQQYQVMSTPWANGLFYFFETAFIGNIATLAFAFIMKPRGLQAG